MNIARIENKLFIISEEVGVAAYDFNCDSHFACDHPYRSKYWPGPPGHRDTAPPH